MKRRELLVAGAVVAIAGCSSDDTSDDPEDENETVEDLEPAGNESENESDDSEPVAGNETDDVVDEQTDGEENEPEEDDGPTDEELAQEHIDAAQGAFGEAIDHVDGTSKIDTTYPSLGTIPPESSLEDARGEIEAALEYEVTKEQNKEIGDLQMAIDTLQLIFDRQPQVYDSYSAATDLLSAIENRDLDAVEADAPGVASTAADLREALKADASDIDVEPTPTVDAIGEAALVSKLETYVTDLSTIEALADGSQPLVPAERSFWGALKMYDYGDNKPDDFESSNEDYSAAASSFEATADADLLGDRTDTITAYVTALTEAADDFGAAAAYRSIDDSDSAAEYEEDGNAALDEADSAGLYDVGNLRNS